MQRMLQQVTRIAGGAILYAYKPTGSVDPLEQDIVWQTAVAPLAGYEPYLMYESLYGQRDSRSGRWGVCTTCQTEFHRDQMVEVKGRLYCTKNGCYKDVQ